MNDHIRALFPAANKYTYLNSAAVSPMPTTAAEAVFSQLRDVSENGSTNYMDWIATKDRARALIAGMLKVRPEQVAFMRNTSDGFATVAAGLPWRAGDNIVSFEREFPANFYPWRRIRDRFGVELRLAPEREGRIDLDEFISLIDANTRVVTISAVQYGSGFKADLARIGAGGASVLMRCLRWTLSRGSARCRSTCRRRWWISPRAPATNGCARRRAAGYCIYRTARGRGSSRRWWGG